MAEAPFGAFPSIPGGPSGRCGGEVRCRAVVRSGAGSARQSENLQTRRCPVTFAELASRLLFHNWRALPVWQLSFRIVLAWPRSLPPWAICSDKILPLHEHSLSLFLPPWTQYACVPAAYAPGVSLTKHVCESIFPKPMCLICAPLSSLLGLESWFLLCYFRQNKSV